MLKKSFILSLCLLHLLAQSAFALELVPIQPVLPSSIPVIFQLITQFHVPNPLPQTLYFVLTSKQSKRGCRINSPRHLRSFYSVSDGLIDRTAYDYDLANELTAMSSFVITSGGQGCFLAGTPILMTDDSSKRIFKREMHSPSFSPLKIDNFLKICYRWNVCSA